MDGLFGQNFGSGISQSSQVQIIPPSTKPLWIVITGRIPSFVFSSIPETTPCVFTPQATITSLVVIEFPSITCT